MDETIITAGPKPTGRRLIQLSGADYYPTPAWATYALIDNETFEGDIWECACGDGAMAKVLELTGRRVVSTDLYDRGFGEAGVDFLTSERRAANIVTNPPYNGADDFVRAGLIAAERKLALLLRLAFIEGKRRHHRLFAETPPSRIWAFSERITFYPAGTVATNRGTAAYAWFIWDKAAMGQTRLHWLKPGYKTRHGDNVSRKKQPVADLFDTPA